MPTEIYDWEDLHNIRNGLTGDYVLMNNLDENTAGYDTYAGPSANSGAGWEPIGNPTSTSTIFFGTFDGGNYLISGLYINRPSTDHVGLFGYFGGNSIIENVRLVGLDVTGRDYVGGLGGTNYGLIQNCFVKGVVSGDDKVGGFIGRHLWLTGYSNNDYIYRCFAECDVYASGQECGGFAGRISGDSGDTSTHKPSIENCYSGGSARCEVFVGGFAGVIFGRCDNCYSRTRVIHSSSTSDGFTAYQDAIASVTNCYWDTDVSGMATSKGTATGKTQSQMKTQATYSGWDITNTIDDTYTWGIISDVLRNKGYPFLQDLQYNMNYGIKIAKPGYDADTADYQDLIFHSSLPNLKIKTEGSGSTTYTNDSGAHDILIATHSLKYKPLYSFMIQWYDIDTATKKTTYRQAPFIDALSDGSVYFDARPYVTKSQLRLSVASFDGNGGSITLSFFYAVYYDPDYDI